MSRGSFSVQSRQPPLWHGKGVVGKVDLLLLLVPFEHREIDNPAEGELVLVNEVQLLGDHVSSLAGEFIAFGRDTAHEEDGIALLQPKLGSNGRARSRPMFLAMGPAPPSSPSRQKM